jgi:hypothetical protein
MATAVMSGGTTSRIVAPEPQEALEPLSDPPTISVVIPAYQAAATIGETVASVLAQTVPPLELIVSDDGSTDALEDALEPHRDAVRLVRNPHGGAAAARNAGVAVAQGDFVLILDADDVLLPRKLEALTALAIVRPDLDLLSTDVLFELNGRRAGRFGAANPFALHDQRTAILENCFVGWPAVRRTRLLDAGGFDESLRTSHDWECWLRMLIGGSTAGLYDEPLSVYRVHDDSITASRVPTLWERARMLENVSAHPGLRADERPVLQRAVAAARVRAMAAEAEEALRDGRPEGRQRALAVARARQVPFRARLLAASAVLAPPLARAWLRRSSRRSVLERSVPQSGSR